MLVRKHNRGFGQQLRSLLVFGSGELHRTGMGNLFPLIAHLRFLRVLDLKSISLHLFHPSGLNYLLQLRYLAIHIDQFDFEWILDLLYLETLVVSGYLLDSSTLENLWNIRSITIFHDDDTDELIERFPNLQALELVIRASNKVVYTGQFYIVFPKLECIAHLESLVVRFPPIWFCIVLPFDFSFPSNIKVFKLVSDLLTAEAVATIAGLPNLEILILKLVSFEQQMWGSRDTWDVGDIVFLVLKILKLKHLMIYKWNTFETFFPILEQLVICSCSYLEKIPPSFANILTLETIKMIHCNKYSNSLESSTLKIKEEVESRTGYEVQVLITRR
ncbi:hypothetical protein K7X08_025744 [Anisodus acutangulus]|uniref:Uncharacterized protein n=1 Tax=Anisodus acutangulus TaxID=402998 RepID=A0A9Q1QXZ0_9SOLA|nr:hypothetical protein K7X08_025744 [Anisodus acutangulus]